MFDRFRDRSRFFSLSRLRNSFAVRGRQLRFEGLENREMLSLTNINAEVAESITPELEDGVLLIRGTDGDDRILIEQTGDTLVLSILAENDDSVVVFESYPVANVDQVEFFAFGGNDVLKFEVDTDIPLYAFGGSGNDMIFGGAGANYLDGGSGDNLLVAGTGTTTFNKSEGDSGGSIFAFRNASDEFTLDTFLELDDSILFFTTEDRDGNVVSEYNSVEYTLREWTRNEIYAVVSMIEEAYSFYGNFNFFKGVNTEDGVTRLRLFDYNSGISLDGINSGDGVIDFNGPVMFADIFIQQFALNWVGTPNPLWNSFRNISWASDGTLSEDAEKNDFSTRVSPIPNSEFGLLGTVSPEYDWATVLTDLFTGQEPLNPSDAWYAKVAIINELFGYLNPNRETPSSVVTTELDIIDANDGLISIREAIWHLGHSSNNTVTFAESMNGKTIQLAGTSIAISKSTIIDATGQNITIDADSQSEIIDSSAASLELIGLTLRGAAGEYAIRSFIAWFDENGGLKTDGILTLTECIVTANRTSGDTLYSSDSLSIISSDVMYNYSTGGDTAYASGHLTLEDSSIRSNEAQRTLSSNSGKLEIWRSSLSGNRNETFMLYGANISIMGSSLEENTVDENLLYVRRLGTIEIVQSWVVGNRSLDTRSSLIHADNSNLEITNSVIAGNSAYRTIYLSSGSLAAFFNTTIAGNVGHLEIDATSSLTMNNSILAKTERVTEDIELRNGGTLAVNSSLIGSISSSAIYTTSGGSMVGNSTSPFDPVFSDYESYTIWESDLWKSWSLGLKLISPAINAGNNDLVPSDLDYDLAGNSRILNGTVDIGAFEIETNTFGTSTLVIRDLSAEFPSGNIADLSGLSGQLDWVDEWSSFWIELWVDTEGTTLVGFENAILYYDPSLFRVDIVGSLDAAGNSITASLIDATVGAVVFSGSTNGLAVNEGENTLLARLLIRPALAQSSSDETSGLIGVAQPTTGYATSVDTSFRIDSKLILESNDGDVWFAVPEQPDALNVYPVLYDLNDDGIINLADISILIEKFGFNSSADEVGQKFDFNYSGGKINLLDIDLLIRSFGKSRAKAQTATSTSYIHYVGNFPASWEAVDPSPLIPETNEGVPLDITAPVPSVYPLELADVHSQLEETELPEEVENYFAKTFAPTSEAETAALAVNIPTISDASVFSSGAVISELDTIYRIETETGNNSFNSSGAVGSFSDLADMAIGLIYDDTEEFEDSFEEIFSPLDDILR